MPFNLVLSSSRGQGLMLSRALLKRTTLPLIALCRRDRSATKAAILSPQDASIDASRVTVLHGDVLDEPSLSSAATKIRELFPGKHAQYIFSTAGILYPERGPDQIDFEAARKTLEVNLLGTMMVMKHFHGFLPKPLEASKEGGFLQDSKGGESKIPVWVNFSARVGSISDNKKGGWYSYRASKAGVNAVTKSFDMWLEQHKMGMAIAYHPGTVKTALSREFWDAPGIMEADVAAEKCLDVVMGLRKEQRGRCWDWKGEVIEW
ncbi:hypothetical protein BZA77DRAFT_312677 [Pyronema omphalodes]|nr:hypothetical protein BZA77DRAFT_312677 [Pyronema omphalodes]